VLEVCVVELCSVCYTAMSQPNTSMQVSLIILDLFAVSVILVVACHEQLSSEAYPRSACSSSCASARSVQMGPESNLSLRAATVIVF
jgi:hypothetical protein